jgi:rare lipoprotein A (peptidoglycan hydrolase)
VRPQSSRARAVVGLGVLSSALAVSGGPDATATAQQAAPAQGSPAQASASTQPAPTATTAGAKREATLQITSKRLNVKAGSTARLSGRLRPAAAGRTVTLERRGGSGWKTIDKARTSSGGTFRLSFRARNADTAKVRVRFAGDGATKPARRSAGRLNVFRPALASWYGPGLYGNKLGCGGTLSAGTIGVAHKSLPCGTNIVLRKGARIVRAKVIDRGPYVGAREFDLTAATKQRLGFGSTGTVLVAH